MAGTSRRRAARPFLSLLSYNIQAGIHTRRYQDYVVHGWRNVLPHRRQFRVLDQIAGEVGAFDLVALQESDSGSFRSGFWNQTEYLANRSGFPYWAHQQNRRIGQIASPGNGLLCRLEPIEVLDCAMPGRVPGRGVLIAQFGNHSENLTVAVVHLSLGSRDRRIQLEYLAELLADRQHMVVLGDFNAESGQSEFQDFLAAAGLQCARPCPTFPSWRPVRSIDHVLHTPELQVRRVETLALQLSDHLPVAVRLQLPAALHRALSLR